LYFCTSKASKLSELAWLAGPADGFDEEDKEGMYPVPSLSIPNQKKMKNSVEKKNSVPYVPISGCLYLAFQCGGGEKPSDMLL
jgi:hypothetical protein